MDTLKTRSSDHYEDLLWYSDVQSKASDSQRLWYSDIQRKAKRSDPEELLESKREVINSGGVSLNSDPLSLITSYSDTSYHLVTSDTFSRNFNSKYLVFVIIKKGEIVRTKFESTTLCLSFDDNKMKWYINYVIYVWTICCLKILRSTLQKLW